MVDLHKPLGLEEKSGSSLPVRKIGVALGVVVLLSLATWFFVDARSPERVVIALEDARTDQPASRPTTVEADNADGTIKPLSPLEPLEGENPASNAPLSPVDIPTFTPKSVTGERLAAWLPNPNLIERSDYGPLPKVSDGGLRPLDAYSQAIGTVGANRLAIVIGGLGLSQTGTQNAIRELPSGVTLAFSPFGNSLQRWMQAARKEGHEIALQIPMEPLGYPTIDPGPGTLTAEANAADNIANLYRSLGRVTNYPVVMNYLGGGLSNNDEAMRPILQELKDRGVAYLDDNSVQASLALDLANEIRLPHAGGSIILDNAQDPAKIRAQLDLAEQLAKSRGFAIATGSAFPETVETLAKWAKDASKRGILIVPVSNLIRDYPR